MDKNSDHVAFTEVTLENIKLCAMSFNEIQ